jgi:hypothetical protein
VGAEVGADVEGDEVEGDEVEGDGLALGPPADELEELPEHPARARQRVAATGATQVRTGPDRVDMAGSVARKHRCGHQ